MQTLFTQYKHKTEGLNHLAEQIAQRKQLLSALTACLTPNTQQALLSAEIIDDTLILVTPSAAWATRLRFDAQKLMRAANNPNLRQYRIQVMAQTTDIVETNKAQPAEKPDEATFASLQSLTDKLDAKDELKASMNRLLRLVSQPTA